MTQRNSTDRRCMLDRRRAEQRGREAGFTAIGPKTAMPSWLSLFGLSRSTAPTTRNSDPAYRKSIWPQGKVAGAGRNCA